MHLMQKSLKMPTETRSVEKELWNNREHHKATVEVCPSGCTSYQWNMAEQSVKEYVPVKYIFRHKVYQSVLVFTSVQTSERESVPVWCYCPSVQVYHHWNIFQDAKCSSVLVSKSISGGRPQTAKKPLTCWITLPISTSSHYINIISTLHYIIYHHITVTLPISTLH